MSIRTTLSIWNDVEIADPGREPLDRPLEDRLRLLALELDRELAGLEFVDQLEVLICRLLPVVAPWPARGPRARPAPRRSRGRGTRGSSRRRRGARASRRSAPRPPSSSSSVGTRRKSERPIAGSAAEAAAHEDVVGLPALRPPSSREVVPWKPMSPTQCCAQACGQPSRCSRRSAISRRRSARPAGRSARRAASSSRRPRSCSAARRCRRSSCRAPG